MSKGQWRWKPAEALRALRVASTAGLSVRGFEIQGGSIRVFTGAELREQPFEANPWDEVFHDAADKKRSS
jgi:hypothetical protein